MSLSEQGGQPGAQGTIFGWIVRRMRSRQPSTTLHCVSKNISDIFDCSLKTNYQILKNLGTNIFDTTCHQINGRLVSHFIQCLLLHCLGKADQAKYASK